MKDLNSLIEKYETTVPRYTSYPTANYFRNGFTEGEYLKLIDDSKTVGPENIAFYVHIPFCKKICYYCGCNACTVKSHEEVKLYISALKKEIREVKKYLNKDRKISQIHYGGGTPNAIDAGFIEEINEELTRDFSFIEQPEIAMECNPAYLGYDYLERLLLAGFNRFSFGIQDFDPVVLTTVNRQPSAIPVPELVQYLRTKAPYVSINLDFIYGLPGQSVESFSTTISKAVEIRPDRLVTFSYAHVPWMKKHQQILEKAGLPGSSQKVAMFLAARDILKQAGYIPLGLDHYVLPQDELNKAFNRAELHRNFQGYCTRRTTGQVYAFGVSAISQLEKGYVQNTKDIPTYLQALESNHLPVEKGLVLSQEQIIIREAINGIMCNKLLDMNKLSGKYNLSLPDLQRITGFHAGKLSALMEDGLVGFNNNTITINEEGSLFIRNIAATLDPAYQAQEGSYSKSI
jgi:oxygen-independent coproporphyrinogen III oxidase